MNANTMTLEELTTARNTTADKLLIAIQEKNESAMDELFPKMIRLNRQFWKMERELSKPIRRPFWKRLFQK